MPYSDIDDLADLEMRLGDKGDEAPPYTQPDTPIAEYYIVTFTQSDSLQLVLKALVRMTLRDR